MSFQNKDMLGISLIEMLKPNIKNKQNDNVIATLDIVKDGTEAYLELLSVAIFHKNLEIIQLIIEKYINSDIDSPYINALCFYNSILPENSKNKLNDNKDNYIEIICPFALMAGIGGDIEIFKYLLNCKLITDLNIFGTIGLSKKFKNVFNSNIIGACAYYGNEKLLEFLLKNYRSELDINIYTTEKQSKKAKINFLEELSGTSPTLLVCEGPASDEKTMEILKILEDYKANFENKDFNNNNIIHISTRRRKINTLKFLIKSLELKDFIDEANNDNMTPFDIAQQMENIEMITLFNSFGKAHEKQNIEDSNKKSNIIIKKELNKNIQNPLLMNYSKYQEEFFPDENIKENNLSNKNCLEDIKDNNNNIIEIKEEKPFNNKEKKHKYNKNDNNNNEVYNYKYSNNNKYNYNYNNNKDNKNYKYKKDYNNYKIYENKDKNKNYNFNNYQINNYKNNNYKNYEKNNEFHHYKNKNSDIYKNTNQKGYYKNNSGFYQRNQNSFNNKRYYENNNNSKNNYIIEKTENISNYNTKISNNINFNNNEVNIKNNEKNENEKDNNIKESKKNTSEEENEDLEEGSFSEEDFLNDTEFENKELNNYEYNKLYKKYLDIERKCYNLEREKKEMCLYINKMNINKKTKVKIIQNNKENINSLLEITNIELESKDKYIKDLKKHCMMADLTNIKDFNKEKLKIYKDFYIGNLKMINNALKENTK